MNSRAKRRDQQIGELMLSEQLRLSDFDEPDDDPAEYFCSECGAGLDEHHDMDCLYWDEEEL